MECSFFFLNNDTQVQKNYLISLIDTLKKDSNVGIVGSMLLNPDNTIQSAGASIYNNGEGTLIGFNERIVNKTEFNYLRETDFVSGAALFLNKELFIQLDGFDDRYGRGYYEDTDLCFRVRLAQKKVVFQPLSRIVHFGQLTFCSELKNRLVTENRKLFFKSYCSYLANYHEAKENFSFLTKDHSLRKKQMLVFDTQVLNPTFDTGSRVTMNYIEFFKKKGFNVKFHCPNIDYKDENSIINIQQKGIEVITTPMKLWLEKNGKYLDYVFLTRPDLGKKYISMLREYTRAYIIFYGHDLHYLRLYRLNVNNNDPYAYLLMREQKKEEIETYNKMDLSVFVSVYEENEVRKELPFSHLETIPIFLFNSEKMDLIKYEASERTDLLFVGGFRHTPNVEGVLWFVHKVFPYVKEKIQDVRFFIIGSFAPDSIRSLNNKDIIVKGYVSEEELIEFYSKVKIVVAPLLSGAGLKGKIIESIFNKVPVVTTTVGAEGIDNNLNVISIADKPEDFSSRIVSLYNNNVQLNSMSNNSKKFIDKYYTENVAERIFSKYIDFNH